MQLTAVGDTDLKKYWTWVLTEEQIRPGKAHLRESDQRLGYQEERVCSASKRGGSEGLFQA